MDLPAAGAAGLAAGLAPFASAALATLAGGLALQAKDIGQTGEDGILGVAVSVATAVVVPAALLGGEVLAAWVGLGRTALVVLLVGAGTAALAGLAVLLGLARCAQVLNIAV